MQFSIHQFSSGIIHPTQNRSGEWVSGGFGAEIANESFPVPEEIQKAINAPPRGGWRMFGIPDAYPPQPDQIALIARDLGSYCVLAVANRLKDDTGVREFVGYRYFWLDKTQFQNHPNGQNIDGIGTLLWYWQQKGQPQFNIGELQTNLSSYTTSWDNLQQIWLFEHWQQQHYQRIQSLISDIRPSHQPLIYEATEIGGQLTYQEVHCLAIQYCTVNRGYINWAWNVRRCENLNNLNVIYCADAEAFNWLSSEILAKYIPPPPRTRECLLKFRGAFTSQDVLHLINFYQQYQEQIWEYRDQAYTNSFLTQMPNPSQQHIKYATLLTALAPNQSPHILSGLIGLKESQKIVAIDFLIALKEMARNHDSCNNHPYFIYFYGALTSLQDQLSHRRFETKPSLKKKNKSSSFIKFSIPDGESIMRIYLYIISGIFSAIIGWSLSQLVWQDIGKLLNQNQSALDAMPLPPPDIILLPIIAASLAVAMVITQILVSNPTKHRLNRREIFSINPARNRSQILPHFWLAVFCGLGAGLFSAVLAWWLYGTNLSGQWVRGICWVVVGLFVGLGEGLSWRSRSMESETERANQRLLKTLILGGLAGLIAAFLVESVRIRLKTLGLAGYEDVISFAILGASLGLGLSVAASPSYAVALRAGAGFEMTETMRKIWKNHNADLPRIMDIERLKLLTKGKPDTPLEENLSILLPYYTGKRPIIIGGSRDKVDIYLPGIPPQSAALSVNNRKVTIECLEAEFIQVNHSLMMESGDEKELRHGQIITFLRTDKPNKHYCFCFYDTLYDPQS